MSSKTIEVLSQKPGKIKFLLPGETENRTVEFKSCSGGGLALCDEKEAEHFLGRIGAPHFRKPSAVSVETEVATTSIASSDPSEAVSEEATAEAPAETASTEDTAEAPVLTAEGYGELKNVKELKAALDGCADAGLIKQLIAIETNSSDPRKSWLEALNDRFEALKG